MRHRRPWEELTLSDDFIFAKVMRQREICALVIEILLGIKVADIGYPQEQLAVDVLPDAKSVRLDVYVEGSGKVFNIEMQVSDEKNLPHRSRYYQSMIDLNNLEKGKFYTELKDSYVIFICTFDPFGKHLPRYSFQNRCSETDLSLNDGTYKLFFNTKASEFADNENLRAFLQYVAGKPIENDTVEQIAQCVKTIKESKQWRAEYMLLQLREQEIERDAIQRGMQRGIEQGMQQGMRQGEKTGLQKGRLTVARKLLPLLDDFTIAQSTELPVEEVRLLRKEYSN